MDIVKKKERSSNWEDREIRCLIEGITEKKEILFGAFSSTITSQKKVDAWSQILININAGGFTLRSIDQLKKKWRNLRSRAVGYASGQRRVPTGGGPREPAEWWYEPVINIVGRDSCSITGIISAIGSGESEYRSDSAKGSWENNEDITPKEFTKGNKSPSQDPLVDASHQKIIELKTSTPSTETSFSQVTVQNKKDKRSERKAQMERLKRKRRAENSNNTEMIEKLMINNMKLEQLKLYYEIKKLEKELGVPEDQIVEKKMIFDMDIPQKNADNI